ncbi:hypothetical protein [Streptomyces thermolilacinus]|uniref:Amino acid ABC transporter permease n=1 Tax=Streptomyces thermolilacinus SPC6 TaxID=1306406 RepID=A0A1D3DUR7_9ACTN|nr:hypothetical protein [Streptomyces thermolilacinus]OEJ96062.1 hypothetical protein J116_017890 [Streptomyces thermolilacinus SPC6]
MSWDEWEQLKTEAAERQSSRMRLNQLPASDPAGGEGGGSSGDLRTRKQAWTRAGEGVKGLKADISEGLKKLAAGQSGVAESSGCQSAAAQKELYDSWRSYVGKVSERCGTVGGLLERAGSDLAMPDKAIEEEFARVRAQYQDTEPVGGQAKGR